MYKIVHHELSAIAYFHSPAEFRTSTKSVAVIGRVHSIYRSVGRALCSVGHLVTS